MELIDLIMLSAASLLPYYSSKQESSRARENAVREAKALWEEVVKQNKK